MFKLVEFENKLFRRIIMFSEQDIHKWIAEQIALPRTQTSV